MTIGGTPGWPSGSRPRTITAANPGLVAGAKHPARDASFAPTVQNRFIKLDNPPHRASSIGISPVTGNSDGATSLRPPGDTYVNVTELNDLCEVNESAATFTDPGLCAGEIDSNASLVSHLALTGPTVPNLIPPASPSTKYDPSTRTLSPPTVDPTAADMSMSSCPTDIQSTVTRETTPSVEYIIDTCECSELSAPDEVAIDAAPGALGGSSHSTTADDTKCASALMAPDTTHADARGSKSAPMNATNRCDPPALDAPRGDDACTNPALCAPTTASDIAFSSAPIATALSTVRDADVCDDAA